MFNRFEFLIFYIVFYEFKFLLKIERCIVGEMDRKVGGKLVRQIDIVRLEIDIDSRIEDQMDGCFDRQVGIQIWVERLFD